MFSRNMAWKMKRALTGLLAAGLVLTSVPTPAVWAANEVLEEQHRPEEGEETSQQEPDQEEKPGTGEESGRPEKEEEDQDKENQDPDNPDDKENLPDEENPDGSDTDTSDDDENKPSDNTPDDNTPDEEDKTEQNPENPDAGEDTDSETPQPGTEEPDEEEPGEEDAVTEEDTVPEKPVYTVQVSGNDISGNDLSLYSEEEEEFDFVGGYIELPEERNIPVVDESAPIDDYGDEVPPLRASSLPSKYISDNLPPTRNQSPYGSCWAHAAMALAEINMVKKGNDSSDNVDYSEHHLAYYSYNFNGDTIQDPLHGLDGDSNACIYTAEYPNYMQRGGNLMYVQNILTSWVGAAEESVLPYPEDDSQLISDVPGDKETAFNDVVHLQNCYQINLKENSNIAKQKIMEYGAVGTAYYHGESYYNKDNNSYYCNDKSTTNHAVTIVGWDDEFSAFEGLSAKPGSPGAWLIRNSWSKGENMDSKGLFTYFWLSYEDTSLSAGYAFDFDPADNYQHNYQYDGSMSGGSLGLKYTKARSANVFTAQGCEKGEQLRAVGVSFAQAQTPYTVYIYKNPEADNPDSGELVATKSGTNICTGFYTIRLDSPVDLENGDRFSVVVELEKPANAERIEIPCESTSRVSSTQWVNCVASAKPGQSFYTALYSDETTERWFEWTDSGAANNANFRIKAYTVDHEVQPGTSGTITYELDGGENSSRNPLSYDSNTDFELEAPTRKGYRFIGWYTDSGFNNPISRIEGSTLMGDLTLYAKWEKEIVSLADAELTLSETTYTYDKTAKEPTVEVTLSNIKLVENTDYTLSYENNISAGTAAVKVTGTGDYSGEATETFEIKKAPLTIKANDITIQVGDQLPGDSDYGYKADGLLADDTVTTSPVYTCTATDSQTAGTYDIVPSGAKVGSAGEDNYDITYEKGILTIAENSVITYEVIFDMQGHGTAPTGYDRIAAGSKLDKPADPTAEGFVFGGWYKEAACITAWDFDADTVEKDLTLYAKWEEKAPEIVSLADAVITFLQTDFTYNKKAQEPKVEVTLSGVKLAEGTDYSLSYENNLDAGTATVKVTGAGGYSGEVSENFEIKRAGITIRAKNVRIRVGEAIPVKYEYEAVGLIEGDDLTKEPSFRCGITSSDTEGEYDIVPFDAEAGSNYEITGYEPGKLTVVDEYTYYKVIFDVQGHGDAPAALERVKEGETIGKPADPTAEGFVFDGWYKEAACTTAWDFDTDTVEDDLTLYAKWSKEIVSLTKADIFLTENDFTYNGTELKPEAIVRVSDVVLVKGTDYTLSYEDNRNAGTATVKVTGIGSYKDTVGKTFTIKKAPLSIWAKDKTILIGDQIPAQYEYGMEGLFSGDSLVQEPVLACDIVDTNEANEYDIVPSGADAGNNYVISYANGKLRVVSELVSYKVTFDVQGHGMTPAAYEDVKLGSTIKEPVDPSEAGYRFGGWYQDAACTREWNFERDTVQADMTLYAKWVKETNAIQEEDVTLEEEIFTYDGTYHRPKVTVIVSGVTLVEGQDYRLTYKNSRDAGIAAVNIFGIGGYSGEVTKYFRIEGLPLLIRAKDKTILRGTPVPAPDSYEYEASGLLEGDVLTREPVFTCAVQNTDVAGQYDIVPSQAEAGKNYRITYESGILTVADEYVSCTVIFDRQGHGGASSSYVGVKVGSTIVRPEDPAEEGYRFAGWYRDMACTREWDFDNDIVQTDLTLYAKWLQLAAAGGEGGFALQEITDFYYTGKPHKPAVSVYDGETLLKAGRDYQIRYYNNTNANANGLLKKGSGAGSDFNAALPYVEIIGKGNYSETIRVNFNILRTSIGDGGANPAAGVTLRVNDQLVTSARGTLKPFSSIKYVKAMRPNSDYTLSLTAVNAKDAAGNTVTGELGGAVIPAGCSGEFLLTVAGRGNYDGSVCKPVHVTDKAHLLKNAAVTLGKNQKNVTFTGKPVELAAGETGSADTFTVKCGGVILKPEVDYKVSYRGNDRIGKAELIVTGAGAYAGSKTVTFNIKGVAFSAKTVSVSGITDKSYTGKAWTQNDAVLTYASTNKRLVYGTDYTVSYSRNINKGTAAMTFKGVDKAGYSGSFKKTFKITAADINQVKKAEGMQNLVFGYCKTGVKPVEEIVLTDQSGYRLKSGKDYTLRYTNNKAVANTTDPKPPTITVKGKGNYAGEFQVYFRIDKADLAGLIVKTTPVAYKNNKADSFAYKPTVKLMDGKSVLSAGKDFEIAYRNNTQADYDKFMANDNWKKLLDEGVTPVDAGVPVAVITEKAGSGYCLENPIYVPLPIYQKQLKKAELTMELGEAIYTGDQVRPVVKKVYCAGVLLEEGRDYTVSYGANIKSGKNRGSVTISGIAPHYGGSVTRKFDIIRKPIAY